MKLPRILANLGAPPQQRHEAEEMKWNLEHVRAVNNGLMRLAFWVTNCIDIC
jgi:hypothetical protein